MSVTLKLLLGTSNYTDFVRVSAIKVSDPLQQEVFVQYIDTPITSYALIIPDLDPDNYIIRFRNAPDTSSLGTIVAEGFYNALTGEFEYERRFYTIGALPMGVSNTDVDLIDPYFAAKNITGVFKEAFRYLIPVSEWTFDEPTTKISFSTTSLSNGEVLIIEIKYNVGQSNTTVAAGIFAATIVVEDASYNVLSTDKMKRHCLNCTGTKQEVIMPPLASLAIGDYYYFEHKRDGLQSQSKITFSGTDKVYFSGFNIGTNLLDQLWVSRGTSLYLRRDVISSTAYWEIIFDYDGLRVGDKMSATYKAMPNWLPENALLCDGDELPGLYWWIRNVLNGAQYIVDDNVSNPAYEHPIDKLGMFVIHSTGKAFRLPNTQKLSERGLKDFITYGTDTTRPVDQPGGRMNWQVGPHGHGINTTNSSAGGGGNVDPIRGTQLGDTANPRGLEATLITGDIKTIKMNTVVSNENIVENNGVIFVRHI